VLGEQRIGDATLVLSGLARWREYAQEKPGLHVGNGVRDDGPSNAGTSRLVR
jgi:hypothetical protein